MKSKVGERGQVTIPRALRDQLGIRPGEVLEFEVEGARLVARKTSARDRVARVVGMLQLDADVDELIEQMRGPAQP